MVPGVRSITVGAVRPTEYYVCSITQHYINLLRLQPGTSLSLSAHWLLLGKTGVFYVSPGSALTNMGFNLFLLRNHVDLIIAATNKTRNP